MKLKGSLSMGNIKTLVTHTLVDEVLKSHKCQRNKKHVLTMGQKRLKVRKGMGWEHYCEECALKILDSDIQKLLDLKKQLQEKP